VASTTYGDICAFLVSLAPFKETQEGDGKNNPAFASAHRKRKKAKAGNNRKCR